MKRYSACLTGLISISLVTSCATTTAVDDTCPNGFSGMTGIGGNQYLVVHDVKAHRDGTRLSIIETANDRNIEVFPLDISDWKHQDGRSSDLEGVCRLLERQGEYLATESGHWDGRYGRLFHLMLDLSGQPPVATVVHAYDLPEFDAKGPDDPHGDEFEGLECAAMADGNILVLLAERGGSPVYPTGLVRWFTLDPANRSLTWTEHGETGKAINPPGVMSNTQSHRDITALLLDDNNALWAVSAEDAGDSGPFTSFLYQIGTVEPDSDDPVRIINNTIAENIMSGLKTEALAGPTPEIPASRFSVATEDECLGGVWRALK